MAAAVKSLPNPHNATINPSSINPKTCANVSLIVFGALTALGAILLIAALQPSSGLELSSLQKAVKVLGETCGTTAIAASTYIVTVGLAGIIGCASWRIWAALQKNTQPPFTVVSASTQYDDKDPDSEKPPENSQSDSPARRAGFNFQPRTVSSQTSNISEDVTPPSSPNNSDDGDSHFIPASRRGSLATSPLGYWGNDRTEVSLHVGTSIDSRLTSASQSGSTFSDASNETIPSSSSATSESSLSTSSNSISSSASSFSSSSSAPTTSESSQDASLNSVSLSASVIISSETPIASVEHKAPNNSSSSSLDSQPDVITKEAEHKDPSNEVESLKELAGAVIRPLIVVSKDTSRSNSESSPDASPLAPFVSLSPLSTISAKPESPKPGTSRASSSPLTSPSPSPVATENTAANLSASVSIGFHQVKDGMTNKDAAE